jgi:uncharacterized protein (TIGR00369 family)
MSRASRPVLWGSMNRGDQEGHSDRLSDADVLTSRVRGVLDIPFHQYLGVDLVDPGDPAAGVTIPVGPRALNNVGLLHGGIVTALMDVACYLALLPFLSDEEAAVTHDISASLMRPVQAGPEIRIAGTIIRRGQKIAFLRAEAYVEDALVAVAQITKSILTSRPKTSD